MFSFLIDATGVQEAKSAGKLVLVKFWLPVNKNFYCRLMRDSGLVFDMAYTSVLKVYLILHYFVF
jgi:hypothetical protein